MTIHISAPEPTSNYLGTPYVTYAGCLPKKEGCSIEDKRTLSNEEYFSWLKSQWEGHKMIVWRTLPEKVGDYWRCRFATIDG